MFYLMLGLILILFYLFLAPKHIKGTMNVVASVFLAVILLIALLLGVLRVIQSPPEIWLGLAMIGIGVWSMWDIYFLDKKSKISPKRRPFKYRYK